MEKSLLEQAELWLDASRHIDAKPLESAAGNVVSAAMAIHAIMKANDALTSHFLDTTASRHDEANRLFADLVKEGHVNSSFAGYRQIVRDATINKSRADYKSTYFSRRESQKLISDADKFVRMAQSCLNIR